MSRANRKSSYRNTRKFQHAGRSTYRKRKTSSRSSGWVDLPEKPIQVPHPTEQTAIATRPDAAIVTLEQPEKVAGQPYIPGLDGLRAIAVIAVLLYHADLAWFQGGFLGVEVFFVISGYLITTLLLKEWREQKTIDLKKFWFRRARRLLPALFAVLIATLVFSVIFLPNEVASLRADVLAAFTYVTNWYLIFAHKSYFETIGRPSLLRHLWSLAVEEQFYLLWPPLLLLGLKFMHPRRVLAVVVGVALLSAVAMALLYQPEVDPSRLYYGTDTRASGLLIGAALAFVWAPNREITWQGRRSRLNSLLLNLAGIGALVVLLAYFTLVNEFQPFLYQGGFVLLSLATAALIAVVVHPLAHLGAGFLNWSPLRWLGLRSYSLYLWHWPIFMITRPQLDLPLEGLPLIVLRFGLACLAADLSYRYIEMPIRNGALTQLWRGWRNKQTDKFRLNPRLGAATALIGVLAVGLTVSVATAKPPAPPSYLAAGEVNYTSTTAAATPTPLLTPTETSATVTANAVATATFEAANFTPTTAPTIEPTATLVPTPEPTATPRPVVNKPAPPGIVVGRVTAVGDSVMVSASEALKNQIDNISINAKVSRYFPDGITVLKQIRDAGELGDVVVVHLGTNWNFTAKQFDDMMAVLKDVRKVVFVNLKMPRSWEAPNNAILAAGVSRYPNAILVDWHGASVNRPDLFWDDGIHLRPAGAKVYASLIAAYAK
ncbi:MAG TPA: acyltransferase family protein [Chloroflexia bacterium]|nr:acyltransferase family protein [Chloroflexia bacterium]